MKTFFKNIAFFSIALLLCSCGSWWGESTEDEQQRALKAPVYTAKVEKSTYPVIRTPKGANQLDLEVPLRCFVNWNTQQMISTIPYNIKAFNLVRNGKTTYCLGLRLPGFLLKLCRLRRLCLNLLKKPE